MLYQRAERMIKEDMIFKGLKFGMLLQLAIGPMCFLVFNTSATHGFLFGLTLVIAIAIVDTLYITLSGLGVATIINRKNIKSILQIFGCIVLIIFGINTILGVYHISFLPDINIFSEVTSQNIFLQGLLLTSSNPLTIIFWSGVFSTQVIENNLNRRQVILFGFGCILSTLLFLTAVSFAGSILSEFMPVKVIQIFNVIVGTVLIYYGIRLLWKK